MKFLYSNINTVISLLFACLLFTSVGCSEQASNSEEHADHASENAVHDDHEGHEGHEDEHLDEHDMHDDHDSEGGIHLTTQALFEAGIETEALAPRIIASSLELPGAVIPHPNGEGFVGSLVEGRIKEIFVDIGDRVPAGEALCIMESPTVGEAEAAYITTLAELEFIKSDLERHKLLAAEGIGSQKEQLELQSQLAASSSALSAAERTLHAFGFNEDDIALLRTDQHTGGKITLRSPISGNIIMRNARLGMQVSPETDLFHIVNMNKLRIRIDIPEQRAADISEGTEVTIFSQNGHINQMHGKVVRLGNSIQHETRTLSAYVTVENTAGLLKPGAFVTVRFGIENGMNEVLAVPLEAVFTDEHGDNAVFIETEPGEFNLREVETGMRSGGWIQLTSGVVSGERVVTKGAFTIKSEANKSELGDGHNH